LTDVTPPGAELRAGLLDPLPATLLKGSADLLVVKGWCYAPHAVLTPLAIVVDGAAHSIDDRGLWSPGVLERERSRDPERRSLRSGFATIVPLYVPKDRDRLEVELLVEDAGGMHQRLLLAQPQLADAPPPSDGTTTVSNLVAICMATYRPDVRLLARQIGSLQAQTHDNWRCTVADDASPVEQLEEVRRLVADDPRFTIVSHETRVGHYRNFERSLRHAPAEAEFVAFADQDDVWRPDKLATLLARIGSESVLACSDVRVVEPDGTVVADTFWTTRRSNRDDLVGNVLANSFIGATMLLRTTALPRLLPFPALAEPKFHDQWCGCVAQALARVTFVDEPLVDYVQHGANAIGHNSPPARLGAGSRMLRHLTRILRGPRSTARRVAGNVGAQWPGESLRERALARALLLRCGDELCDGNRRALERVADPRSVRGIVWLLVRATRRSFGPWRTYDREWILAGGALWSRARRDRDAAAPERGTEG
jgi:glycosyltransferase involved in cell wall biosynthesis